MALATTVLLTGISTRPAAAEVEEVTASAFAYYTDLSLFGGPLIRKGFGQILCDSTGAPAGCTPAFSPASASPSVACPFSGTTAPVVDADPDGAKAQYGIPVTIFSGQWLPTANSPPPSGPLTATCSGTIGTSGGAASSADALNVGPGPFIADEVHSTCTATEDGVTGTTTIVGGVLETSYDVETEEPATTYSVPLNPEPNTEVLGEINHVGDSFRAVFNEQILNPDGSLTVNAVHLHLLGPTAVGDMVIASSTCGVGVAPDEPTSKDQCKNGGFASFGFRDQGQCVSSVVRRDRT